MDLSDTTLQIPTGTDSNTGSVKGSDLKSYNSQYFQYSNGKITFQAPVNGAHNAHSNFSRSELSQNQGWKLASGNHSLSPTVSVEEAPSNKDIVIGQLPEKSSATSDKPRPPIELHWTDGKSVASVLQGDSLDAGRKSMYWRITCRWGRSSLTTCR